MVVKKPNYLCRKKIKEEYTDDTKYHKFRDYWPYIDKYRGAAHSRCNLKQSIPKEILVIFQNESNYEVQATYCFTAIHQKLFQ